LHLIAIKGHRGTEVAMKYIQNSDNSRLIDANLIGGAKDTRLKSLSSHSSSISTVSSSSYSKPTSVDGWNCLSGATFNNSNINIFIGSRGPEMSSSADTSPTFESPTLTLQRPVPVFQMPPIPGPAPPPIFLLPPGGITISDSLHTECANELSTTPTVESPTLTQASPPLTQESLPLPDRHPLLLVSGAPLPAPPQQLEVYRAPVPAPPPLLLVSVAVETHDSESESEDELSYTQHCVALRETCTFRSTRAPRNSAYSPPPKPRARQKRKNTKLPLNAKRNKK
jgi:hypothetical protein